MDAFPEICDDPEVNFYNLSLELDFALTLVRSDTEIIFRGYVMPIIMCVCLLGNGAFLFVVVRVREMRTVTNFYLSNLAVADIAFVLTGTIEKMYYYYYSPLAGDLHTAIGAHGCVIITFLKVCAHFASIFLLTMVTVEKFYSICKPLQHRLVSGWDRTFKITVAVWLLAVLLTSVSVIAWSDISYVCVAWPEDIIFDKFPPLIGRCRSPSYALNDAITGIETVPFFAAMIINVYLYVRIILSLHRRVRVADGQPTRSKDNQIRAARARNVVARMLIINGVVFFLCLAPFKAASLAIMIESASPGIGASAFDYDALRRVMPAFQSLQYINSTINPFIYGATNPHYRKKFRQAMGCRWLRRGNDESLMASNKIGTVSTNTNNVVTNNE